MNDHVIAEIAVCPLGTGSPDVGAYVKRCVDTIRNAQDIKYEINSMGTTIEGPLTRIMQIFLEINEIPFGLGAKRVYSVIKIDDRRDKEASIQNKVKAVS